MSSRRSSVVFFAACCGVLASPANAQSVPAMRPGMDVAVTDAQPVSTATRLEIEAVEAAEPARRSQRDDTDPYAPSGIRIGGMTYYPAVTVGLTASSNIEQSASDPRSAVGLEIQPRLRFESDWTRHSWIGNADFDLIRYLDEDDIKSQNGEAFTRLQIDVRRTTRLDFDAGYVLDQEGQGDSEVPSDAVGFQTEHTITAGVALGHDMGRFEARVRAGVEGNLFDDVKLAGGGTEDNADRNYAEPNLTARVTYAEPPVFKPYLQASYLPRIYQEKRDRNGLERSSQGFGAAVGVVIDNNPIWNGDIAATYLTRNYDDPLLDTNHAFGFNGSLEWNPTELTNIVLSLGTSLPDSISTTSSGYREWTADLAMSYDLRDNVELQAVTGVEIERGDSGDDVTYDMGFGIDWRLNPVLAWTAGYDFTWLDAADGVSDYTEHQVSLGMTFSR